jgi:hypothetical protein
VSVVAVTFVAAESVELVSYRNPTATELADPRAERYPFRVAVVCPFDVAAYVATEGGVVVGTKLKMDPATNPSPEAQAAK